MLPRANRRPIKPEAEKQNFTVPQAVGEDLTLIVNKYQNLCGNDNEEKFSSLAPKNSLELIQILVHLSYKSLLKQLKI